MNEAMKKVRRIYVIRRLAVPFVVFVGSAAILASAVSVGSVLENMPDLLDVQAVAKFFLSAFAHTEMVIKSVLVAGIAFLIMTLKRAVETMRFSMTRVEA